MGKDSKSANPNKKAGSKKAQKKWGGAHVKDKINNTHIVDQKLYDRILKETSKMSLISVATVSDRFKVGGSVSRAAMRELLAKDLIVRVGEYNSACPLYRGADWSLKKEAEEAEAKAAKGGKKKK